MSRWRSSGTCSAKTVLDVGCGPGRYAVAAAERGADIIGIDFSPKMLELARERALDRGVADRCRFVEADFDAYQPEERFDIVLMMGLLEFRADPERDLARLSELATEKVIVNIPPPFRWRTTARRVRHRLRPAPPSYYVHSPATIGACLEEVGFRLVAHDRGLVHGLRGPGVATRVAALTPDTGRRRPSPSPIAATGSPRSRCGSRAGGCHRPRPHMRPRSSQGSR